MKKETITIRDLTSTGEGVGAAGDRVVFVDKALPQEKVDISITAKKKSYSKGALLEIITPSEHRVTAPCKYFGTCGGCQLQHADSALQLEVKKNRVVQSLKRIAGIENPPVSDCVSSPDSFGYRNKITIPLLDIGGEKKIGFFKKRSHDLVSIDTCLLHIPFADVIYQKVRSILLTSDLSFYNEKEKTGHFQHLVLRTSEHENAVLIGIIGLYKPSKMLKQIAKEIFAIPHVKGVIYGHKSKASNSIYPEYEEVLEGEATLTENILSVPIEISLLSFFQVNRKCAELLYKKAYDFADVKKGDKVLDAYSGIGSFAIFLAKQGLSVTGIESFKKAVLDAKYNAKKNGASLTFIEGTVEDKVADLSGFDCVFINPPRKGVHIDVIDALGKISPKKIIYTSCDPGTLSRDIKLLMEKGYTLTSAAPFDMFPQTMHVETVACLTRDST
ncbi:MAG: 23S rRNA (uracil-C(5))-methyltransferase RlmCD [Chlamydiia bacterium]|nr:23S rRNA (uracil-C(5))-methyltransferase RlmCD [Chlamydiia bacterium]MCH9617903.1 23S rRNA (uracil-C(5))-methyltransferase RlmCD [Chlamydiia bacterium]MCH9624119.1 23S rRNA (uracil-C(5))-methyltransferase RlmCD [Chlamydiia bacterium]